MPDALQQGPVGRGLVTVQHLPLAGPPVQPVQPVGNSLGLSLVGEKQPLRIADELKMSCMESSAVP